MADGLEVPLGILKEGISGGEFLPESCCRSNIGESEGNGGIGVGSIGIMYGLQISQTAWRAHVLMALQRPTRG